VSIVITGATGKLGLLIIERLLEQVPAQQIVACVRRLDAGKPYEAQGIEVRYCDYDRPESLAAAFAGASRLLMISSPHHDDTIRLRQHAHVIEAAKQSKVEHLLYTGFAFPERGACSPVWMHLATEYAIRAAGMPFTFLRNALYTDFVQALDLPEAIGKGQLDVAPGDWSFHSVTRRDLAVAIAAVLAAPGEHRNRTYELAAPVAWTFADLAAILSELSGWQVAVQQDSQVRHWIYGFLARIDTSSTSNDLTHLLGRPVTTLRESVKELLAP